MLDKRRLPAGSVKALHHRVENWGINADRNMLAIDATRICSNLKAKPVRRRRHRAESSETRKWNIRGQAKQGQPAASMIESPPPTRPSCGSSHGQLHRCVETNGTKTFWLLFQVSLLHAAYSAGNSIRILAKERRSWTCMVKLQMLQMIAPQGARRRLQESGRSFDIYKHRAWQPQRLLDNWRASLRSAQKVTLPLEVDQEPTTRQDRFSYPKAIFVCCQAQSGADLANEGFFFSSIELYELSCKHIHFDPFERRGRGGVE